MQWNNRNDDRQGDTAHIEYYTIVLSTTYPRLLQQTDKNIIVDFLDLNKRYHIFFVPTKIALSL